MKARGRRPATRATPTGGTPATETATRGEGATTGATRTAAATTDRAAGTPTEATGEPQQCCQVAVGMPWLLFWRAAL